MLEDRQIAIELIDEAVTAGARRFKACAVLEIDVRTLQRWKKALAGQQGLDANKQNHLSAGLLDIYAVFNFTRSL